jgi:hypothetical protein
VHVVLATGCRSQPAAHSHNRGQQLSPFQAQISGANPLQDARLTSIISLLSNLQCVQIYQQRVGCLTGCTHAAWSAPYIAPMNLLECSGCLSHTTKPHTCQRLSFDRPGSTLSHSLSRRDGGCARCAEGEAESIRRQVLTGLERLPAMIIIVDHLGKEVQAPHADSALSTPTASSRMHAPRRTRKNRRALTVVGLGVMLALIKLAPVCATPSKRVHQSFAEAGECGCVRARERREHGSDIQGRLVPQLCHPGKAVTLGRVNCEC